MDRAIFIVGLGGTGGLLVPKIAKIFNDSDVTIWLMDGDTVDKGNVQRQPYQSFNMDEKKATALSRKVRSNYNLKSIEYCEYLVGDEITNLIENEGYREVVIVGCVDNHSTRRILEDQFKKLDSCLYIDSANGLDDGSVFITWKNKEHTKGALRSEIFPEILEAADHPTGTCGQEIAKGNHQQMTTNDTMANTIAIFLNRWYMNEPIKTGVVSIDGLERVFVPDHVE